MHSRLQFNRSAVGNIASSSGLRVAPGGPILRLRKGLPLIPIHTLELNDRHKPGQPAFSLFLVGSGWGVVRARSGRFFARFAGACAEVPVAMVVVRDALLAQVPEQFDPAMGENRFVREAGGGSSRGHTKQLGNAVPAREPDSFG